MSDRSPFAHERLLELLADQASVGLAPNEDAELAALAREYPGENPFAFDAAAAALDLALTRGKVETMPAHLADRIANAVTLPTVPASGRIVSRRPREAPPEPRTAPKPRRQRDWVRASGWLAAAACFVLAIASASWALRDRIMGENPVRERAELLTRAGARRLEWTRTKDPAAQGASGDVVFSVSEQRGYMRFHGLAPNDATKQQYQLWIFDAAQDERYPIDGGVFDVDTRAGFVDQKTGDVIVAIHPKIRVTSPTLFAVTVEKPGGVVVSKRERIVVTATTS